MWRGVVVFVLVGVGAAACSDSSKETGAAAVADCKSRFSRDKGFGFENDLVVSAAPPDGGPGMPPDPEVVLAEVVANCQAAGAADCDPNSFLTREGAFCVARTEGFPEGLRPWLAGIRFDERQGRVVWSVLNTLSEDPGGSVTGQSWVFDAVTGALLRREAWGATS
jgi:hypothetical protein